MKQFSDPIRTNKLELNALRTTYSRHIFNNKAAEFGKLVSTFPVSYYAILYPSRIHTHGWFGNWCEDEVPRWDKFRKFPVMIRTTNYQYVALWLYLYIWSNVSYFFVTERHETIICIRWFIIPRWQIEPSIKCMSFIIFKDLRNPFGDGFSGFVRWQHTWYHNARPVYTPFCFTHNIVMCGQQCINLSFI